MLASIKTWAKTLKRDAHALYLAARDPRVPWYAKGLAIAVAAYALSPIDLIPDFIPIIGYLDDLIIVPLGIALVVRMIPPDVMAEHRALADSRSRPSGEPDCGRQHCCHLGRFHDRVWLARLSVFFKIGH